MQYTDKQAVAFYEKHLTLLNELQWLSVAFIAQSESVSNPRSKEYLTHGVCRRLSILRRTLSNIFQLFPPSTTRSLSSSTIDDVHINIHAFMINLYGLFDDMAWAFVFRHNLDEKIPRLKVSLFKKDTSQHLPQELQDYLNGPLAEWHNTYLKSYRDALAHRIAPYVPPAEFRPEDGEQFNRLEAEKKELIKEKSWEQIEEITTKQAQIGEPCFIFMHSFSEDEKPTPILLHPQICSDLMGVVEFGNLFLKNWHTKKSLA